MLKLLKPYLNLKSKKEDEQSKEIIIKIISSISFVLSLFCFLINLINYLKDSSYLAISPFFNLIITTLFILIWFLAHRRLLKLAAWLIIFSYLIPTAYSSLHWGTDLPQTLLLYTIIIVISGILLSSRSSFIITIFIGIYLTLLTYLIKIKLIKPDLCWTQDHQVRLDDSLIISLSLLVIATLIWLYNSEINKSLDRARKSEKALQLQKENLEKTVIERTKQIKTIQKEKIITLYQMAEFGQLSAGMFHDLANPLTAVSLNLEQIKSNDLNNHQDCLKQALIAANKMSNFIINIKKQIKSEDETELFNINQEIHDCIKILDYKARINSIEINHLEKNKKIYLLGIKIKFNQIILNLVSNSIDSYLDVENNKKLIIIKTFIKNDHLIIEVKDFGQGIKNKNQEKIFEPFFTTKMAEKKGIGIGLYSSLHIARHYFQGNLKLYSKWGKGTKAELKISKNIVKNENHDLPKNK